ncbi:hypothetical protein [Desulfofundulus thermocisternus]|uniref:hypothetical protein n=1 Tax=Desulfofundulus thermocisternus TaxID=42471 RepID=UPI00217EB416|nr:hypothetical protein [Desulfofundulus thermocisternus]MCS5696979.1 hypothetical protein [Desulfofundulus thermocisternus]
MAEKQASGENVLKPVPPEERREICSLPPEVIKKLGYDPGSCNDWIACRVMLSEYGPKGRATIAQNGKVKGTIETDYRNDEIAFPIKYGDKVEIRWIPGESKGGNPTCQITFWKIDKRVNIDPNLPTVSLDAIDLKEEANWQQGGWYKFPPSGNITFEYTEKGMIINAQKE